MPQLQKLWEANKDKGFNMFHVEAQGHSKEEVTAFLRKRGVTFPNTTNRGDFSGFTSPGGLPYAFVIGVDGKVIWEGRSGYKMIIHQELEKIRYPGLGKLEVEKGLEKAAGYFGMKNFAKAIAEAEKKQASAEEAGNSALVADAKYIVARANSMGDRMEKKVAKLKGEKEYTKALQTLQMISQGFKGLERGDKAKTELKALKKDPTVKAELKADATFEQLKKRLVKIYDPAEKKAHLEAFAKKFSGRKAAERAREMINFM